MNAPVSLTALPRGNYTDSPLCAPRSGKRFYQCPICGGWVDSADLAQVVEHEGGLRISATTALPTDAAEAS
jgi:hypothetical protein